MVTYSMIYSQISTYICSADSTQTLTVLVAQILVYSMFLVLKDCIFYHIFLIKAIKAVLKFYPVYI